MGYQRVGRWAPRSTVPARRSVTALRRRDAPECPVGSGDADSAVHTGAAPIDGSVGPAPDTMRCLRSPRVSGAGSRPAASHAHRKCASAVSENSEDNPDLARRGTPARWGVASRCGDQVLVGASASNRCTAEDPAASRHDDHRESVGSSGGDVCCAKVKGLARCSSCSALFRFENCDRSRRAGRSPMFGWCARVHGRTVGRREER